MRPSLAPGVVRVLAGIALVPAIVMSTARPASAHAVLLRTDPSPQTTVATPPPAVRLEFSEPVEVAFGSVRVFDVDGKRVDEGKVRSASGRREIVVPASLPGGTYTVTWRVVTTDGHRIHGTFQFYVGAPSTISPVPVTGEAGGGRVVGWAYGAVRFTWYAALLGVVGLVVIARFVWTPAMAAAGLTDSEAAARFERRVNRVLPWAWVLLLTAWLLRLAFQTASISGLPLTDTVRPGVLGDVVRTDFGRSWAVGLAFTALAGVAIGGLTRRAGGAGARADSWLSLLAASATGLALAVANMGHARTESLPALGVPSAAIHLLAVSVWVGGLAALVAVGPSSWSAVPRDDRPGVVRRVVVRFSRVALLAVTVLVVTGAVNSFLDLASVTDLWRTTYGRVLSAKVLLLALALGFGAWHFRIVPRRLAGGRPDAGAVTRSFRWSSTAELVVLATVVAFASALVALVPGRSLALLARGPVNQDRQVGDHTVQLFIDPSAPGRNEIHVTFVDPNGLGAGDVTSLTASLARADGTAPFSEAPVAMQLISTGHFVGYHELAAGRYRLAVSVPRSPPLTTTFQFKVRTAEGARG